MGAARLWRAAILTLLAAAAAGCTHVDLTQARSPCWKEPGAWCGFTRDFAVQSWEYAQLAQNTYEDDEDFAVLPETIVLRSNSGNSEKGYSYAIYDRMDGPVLKERIIAYRGTEFSFADWLHGNLSRRQNQLGLMTYEEVRAGLDREQGGVWSQVPISVTGHSLGGGIALEVSMKNADVDAFVFNESPNFEVPAEPAGARRLSVVERGDPLGRVRDIPTWVSLDTLVLNCRPASGPGSDHSIRKLAECLTWVAAYEDPDAYQSVQDNRITKPPIEPGDPNGDHPGAVLAKPEY
jgi:hypothetical protein